MHAVFGYIYIYTHVICIQPYRLKAQAISGSQAGPIQIQLPQPQRAIVV